MKDKMLDTVHGVMNGPLLSDYLTETSKVTAAATKRTIYILGAGAIGCYIACMLRSSPNSKDFNIHLLLRSEAHLQEFKKKQAKISYESNRRYVDSTIDVSSTNPATEEDYHQLTYSGFEASVSTSLANDKNSAFLSPSFKIDHLILATKAHNALEALTPLVSRLYSGSTLLLLHNGAGVADLLIDKLWSPTSNSTAPTIYIGVTIHALHRTAPFHISHDAGLEQSESLWIGQIPTAPAAVKRVAPNLSSIYNQQRCPNNFLIDTLLQIPGLQAVQLDWYAVRQKQLFKLVANASINAMAALLGSDNSKTLNLHCLKIVEAACHEFHQVFKEELPQGETWCSLKEKVVEAVIATGRYRCSMLQDVMATRLTEVDHINGYICRMGQLKGVETTTHQTLVHLVHAKEALFMPRN